MFDSFSIHPLLLFIVLGVSTLLGNCVSRYQPQGPVQAHQSASEPDSSTIAITVDPAEAATIEIVPADIRVKRYFSFMDSLVSHHDTLHGYPLTEHILVHANPWIIDTLESFDYYTRMEAGQFIEDQKEMVVLHRGDTLIIPDKIHADNIRVHLSNSVIDVNIPEYKLRIRNQDSVLYTYEVRVGKNSRRYLKTAGREVDLRTPVGEGEIVRIENDPWYINPVDGRRYHATNRDDGRVTRLPRIPFLEPMIAGLRQGALIHPTTNRATLGKAYSNGCVGTGEGAAWRVYYHAPLGTRVVFRYDLHVPDGTGRTVTLDDIYNHESREEQLPRRKAS